MTGRGADPLSARVAEVFVDAGSLAQALPSFESRPAQRQMADAVATTLQNGGVLLVEAGPRVLSAFPEELSEYAARGGGC